MKYGMILPILLVASGCGFFKDYAKDNQWSYFEEWDANADAKVDKNEFAAGCVRDKFVKKADDPVIIEWFNKADEDKDGVLTGLEFYRWKIDFVDS